MGKRYYLAYGSNLNTEQMLMRCPSARIIGTAVIRDCRLLFRGSRTGAYLTIEPAEGRTVPAGVWEVPPADEARLDRCEGCPVFYRKAEMTLPVREAASGRTADRRCFVYIMREDSPVGLPSARYMKVCLEGCRDFGFDRSALLQAYRESREGLR